MKRAYAVLCTAVFRPFHRVSSSRCVLLASPQRQDAYNHKAFLRAI
jgi:hypothetical protein